MAGCVVEDLGPMRGEINVLLIDDREMRKMNRRYKDVDASTDVLAFPRGKDMREGFLSGDIAISTDKAALNAKVYDTGFVRESALYVIHGILHLAGYDDTTPAKKRVMKKKENEILKKAERYL
ncbi:MAG: rRNA maturation RNase YbeY [Candidatus Omnitrophica bacterium]|nr:rRNA maturation RNase YbeY [Candidatus Omnitrophota bacterium]